MAAKPTVYLFHGDDPMAMEEAVDGLIKRQGDPANATMNTQRFSSDSADLAEVAQACAALPFLADRRIVILKKPGRWAGDSERWARFQSLLESLPASTALVLTEPALLSEKSPLLRWAQDHPEASLVRSYATPQGGEFDRWLIQRCEARGGSIEPTAAQLLAELVADDAERADQELAKVLDYVDYSRPIRTEDIERLTAFHGQADVFEVVDALGKRDAHTALARLQRLLEDEDAHYVFAMIIRQFRLLLRAREALDSGLAPAQAISAHPVVLRKVTEQARNFTLSDLERIYHHLAEIDLADKSNQTQLDTALIALVAAVAA
jgi:DNA polymerase-3 subunit delta